MKALEEALEKLKEAIEDADDDKIKKIIGLILAAGAGAVLLYELLKKDKNE